MVAAIAGATRSGDRLLGSTCLISQTAAPRMAGTAIIRLKPTAQVRDSPRASAVAIVKPAPAHAGQGCEHLGQSDQQGVDPGHLRRPFVPSRRLSHAVSIKTAAVIKKPTPAYAIPSNVFSINFFKKSASGISGRRGDRGQRAPRARARAGETRAGRSSAPESPRMPWAMGSAIMDQNRRRRPQVEDHVEEQIFLACLRDARQPGKQILRQQQMAVARYGQKFSDSLHDAQNQ